MIYLLNICDESAYYYDQFQLNIKGLYFWVCLGRTCGIAGAGVSMVVSSITYMIGIILMTPLAKLFSTDFVNSTFLYTFRVCAILNKTMASAKKNR
jgi:hypothetical protein